jgi:1-aminocyclopropane-1-carboxylate deaminase/D-cysteine desulfhydrase-like pyridoxal-dependent ACC family enzyme
MKVEEMPVYKLTKEMDDYLREMNGGILDAKGMELIMKIKMNDNLLLDCMYKIQAFGIIEGLYENMGDELFTPKHANGLKTMFKEIFNY